MSDAEFDAATESYRLIRIHRMAERTGQGGPGDLSWIWPVATFILLPLVLIGRKRNKE
jgi:hypothetical protein